MEIKKRKQRKQKKIKNGLAYFNYILFYLFYIFTLIRKVAPALQGRVSSTASNKNTAMCAKRGALRAQCRLRRF